MPTLKIITFDSPGLLNDVNIYKNIFKNNKVRACDKKYKYPTSSI